jgi:hypothetical protein
MVFAMFVELNLKVEKVDNDVIYLYRLLIK